MSVSYIKPHIIGRLWGNAGGRCEYRGCNKPLWIDSVTKAKFNKSYIAHIIADKPAGPRGDKVLSKKLKDELSNLMLLCDTHHRLIDKIQVENHTVAILNQMKDEHEERIITLTEIRQQCSSNIILYGANIGKHGAPITYDEAVYALAQDKKYSEKDKAIELSLKNSSFEDKTTLFWKTEKQNLRNLFKEQVEQKIKLGEFNNFSIFAIAPQPLLIELGRLFGEISNVSVFQKHREPPCWAWQKGKKKFLLNVIKPKKTYSTVALNLSLSATINNDRIYKVLGKHVSIWTITTPKPNNEIIKNKDHLSLFRTKLRALFNEIKAIHGEQSEIKIFPAVPVSIAIEIGRVWMPKADLPIIIYDQNRTLNGFVKALEIK